MWDEARASGVGIGGADHAGGGDAKPTPVAATSYAAFHVLWLMIRGPLW
jgi:hypothetical protein